MQRDNRVMNKLYLRYRHKKAIKKRAKEANKFLSKTSTLKNKKNPKLNSLPYYISIGPSNAGKTTLLANSELKFILAKNFKSIDNVQNTKNYNWWATKHAVVIDTPGANFSSINNKSNYLQKYFLRLIKQYNHNTLPSGILLILDLDDLLRKPKKLKQKFFDNINKQLTMLTKVLHAHVPLYLIFNKCDLITGFREYFNDLGREERQQIWGNLIKTRKINNQSFADNFNGIFHKMILRLNNQLIWRLQHEHNYDKRALINEFPTKMIQLKKPLTQLLNKAFRRLGENFCPAGIFFVSAIQKRGSSFYQNEDTVSSNARSLINIRMPDNKAYFVYDLFNNHLFAEKVPVAKLNAPTYKPLIRLLAYPSLIALAGFLILACWYKFDNQQKLVNQVKQIIVTDQLAGNDNHQATSLHTLKQINLALTKHAFLLPFIRNSVNSVMQQKISSLYHKKLNAILLPRIKSLLLKNLQTESLPPDQLYANLKSYLMLGSSDQYDKEYLKKSLTTILIKSNKETAKIEFLPYINDFLANYSPNLKLNHHLIKSSRNKLKKLDVVDLAFAILSNESPNNQLLSLNFSTNQQAAFVFTFADDNINIPSIYTAQNFALVYPTLINQAAQEATHGNWVMDKPSSKQLESNLLQVTQQLTKKYLLNYADVWVKFIENIKMVNFTKLDHLITATKLLSGNDSPLLELAKLVQDNIVPQVAAINPMLKNFSAVSNNILQQDSAQNMMQALQNLYAYLQPIIMSDNTKKQTFKITSIRMRNNGSEDDPIEHLLTITQSYPEPIKSWLYNLTTNSWHLMLLSSEDYINSIWQKNIVPQYNAQIANHFPFASIENNDVSLTNFSYFFAPHGLIDKFFKDYLDAFVDSSQLPWKLKNLDGDSLPIYPSTLSSLQKAFQIQRTYFRRSDQSLYVPFSIQALAIKNNTESFTIALGNQQKTYQQGILYDADQFIWPDDVNSNLAKVVFTGENNNHVAINEHGPWAWFKLLQPQKTKADKNHYKILLSKKDLAAKIDLVIQQSHNPFALTLFRRFKLPDNL